MVRFFGCGVDIKTSDCQAKIKRMEGSILREISVNLIVIGQRHWGRVIIVPPRGKEVPEGVNMLAFYNQTLYGLLRFTHITGVTVSNFGLEKFVASVQDVMVYFKLKHRKLYVFCELEWKNVQPAILLSVKPVSKRRTSDAGFWKDFDI